MKQTKKVHLIVHIYLFDNNNRLVHHPISIIRMCKCFSPVGHMMSVMRMIGPMTNV